MDIAFRYTSHQVARGSRPDAVTGGRWYLIKNVTTLRLTYQIRLLTFLAKEEQVQLRILVPKGCRLSKPMRSFTTEEKHIVRVERRD